MKKALIDGLKILGGLIIFGYVLFGLGIAIFLPFGVGNKFWTIILSINALLIIVMMPFFGFIIDKYLSPKIDS